MDKKKLGLINKSKLDNIEFRDCESLPYGNGCDCTADDQCVSGSKCEILFTSQNCVPKTNAKLPNLIATDQFGEQVELYDFANQGKYILIEVLILYGFQCVRLYGGYQPDGFTSNYQTYVVHG